MESDFEVRHRLGRKHMATDSLSRLHTDQRDDSDFDNYIPAYAVAIAHDVADNTAENTGDSLTVQQFLSAQRKHAHCRQLAKIADAPDSSILHDEFGILSRRARLDKAIKKFISCL